MAVGTQQLNKALVFAAVDRLAGRYGIDARKFKDYIKDVTFDMESGATQGDIDALVSQMLTEIQAAAEDDDKINLGDGTQTIAAKDLMQSSGGFFDDLTSSFQSFDRLADVVGQFKNEPLLIPLYALLAYASFLAVKGAMRKSPAISGAFSGMNKALRNSVSNSIKLTKGVYKNVIKK